MPDWTYQTLFRSPLRTLPFSTAQAIVFRTMGLLGRFSPGRSIIRLMGHAQPPADAKWHKAGLSFPGRSGLGCGVDVSAQAVSATSLFGFGMIEAGPVYASPDNTPQQKGTAEWRQEGVFLDRSTAVIDQKQLLRSLKQNRFRNGVPVFVRVLIDSQTTLQHCKGTAEQFVDLIDGFSVAMSRSGDMELADCRAKLIALKSCGHKLLIVTGVTGCDWGLEASDFDGWMIEAGCDDMRTAASPSESSRLSVQSDLQPLFAIGSEHIIAVNVGIEQPAEALELIDAGVDLVMVDSGFVQAGPGLPKRINAAVKATRLAAELSATNPESRETDRSSPIAHQSWFWSFLLGVALTVGGVFAVVLGWTRVLLPYDEEFLGMLRDEICSINTRLLPFMSHDRVTLAGTMISLGPLYMALAWFGDRHGMHWARVAVLVSAFLGFLSFFLFLGFGYFDAFHAFISAVLFQVTLLCLRSHQLPENLVEYDLYNTSAWRRAMWGQLLMVVQGVAIIVGGAVICLYGITTVFVSEDLEFMQTTREALVAANPRLIPLVAHDRAGFGGMLLSTGITVLLTALWGWQRGRRWLWYTLAVCGSIAYGMTVVIHWYVGYTSLVHLLPAYGGFTILWLSLLVSREWMFEDSGPMQSGG